MASYGTIRSGSRGDSVKQLQQLLNQNGANIAVDGIFGSKTAAAVRNYQQSKGLSIDGIVGKNTWNSLLGSGTTTAQKTDPNYTTLQKAEENRPKYEQSQAVKDAADALAKQEQNKPGEYQSQYAEQIQQLLDKILNREQFSYDMNADPLYQQYKNQYVRLGQNAMQDTMGNAAALTGGYGSSYATTAGNQAYQGYLQNLNDVVPELYNAAYNQYRDKGTEMYNQVGLLQGMDESDYGKYRDTVSDYYNDLNYYYQKYGDMSADEYNRYLSDLDAWQHDRDYYYGKYSDAEQLAFQKSEAARDQANIDREYALAASKARSSGSSSKKKSNTKTSVTTDMNALYKEVVDATGNPGIRTPAEFARAMVDSTSTVEGEDGKKYRQYADYLKSFL